MTKCGICLECKKHAFKPENESICDDLCDLNRKFKLLSQVVNHAMVCNTPELLGKAFFQLGDFNEQLIELIVYMNRLLASHGVGQQSTPKPPPVTVPPVKPVDSYSDNSEVVI